MADDVEGSGPVTYDLEQGAEWRFELQEPDEAIAIRALGMQPLYLNSQEIPPNTWYPLHANLKGAIYSPHTGGKLEASSAPSSCYTSTNSSSPLLVSIHLALERERILAKRAIAKGDKGKGPAIMVMGPACSGKSTVVKSLVNMALGSGMGWSPGVVGLDPANPPHLVSGSLSLSTPLHPLPSHHPAHSLGSTPTSMPSNSLATDIPTLSWWYGSLEPTTKQQGIWCKVVDDMGRRWRERCGNDTIANASGMVIDTPKSFTNPTLGVTKADPKARYPLVKHAVEAFGVDVLLVIGPEKLTIEMEKLLAGKGVKVLRMDKSGGVVELDTAYNNAIQSLQVRSYYYGEPRLPPAITQLKGDIVSVEPPLSPYSFQIGWEHLTILRVGEDAAAPSSALPLGSARVISPTRLTKVDPSGPAHVTRLLNAVLAIVRIDPEDRIVKEQPAETVKAESAVKTDPLVKTENGEASVETAAGEEEEDDEDEDVPLREEIGWRDVVGFIVITAIDPVRKKYTILTPCMGKLPSTTAIAGAVEWIDQE